MNQIETVTDAAGINVRIASGLTSGALRIVRDPAFETADRIALPSGLYFDCGPGDPERDRDEGREEIVTVFRDFESQARFDLVIELRSPLATGTWTLNDWARSERGEISTSIRIAADRLEPWENTIHLRGEHIAVEDVYFATRIDGSAEMTIRPLHSPWRGELELTDGDRLVASEQVSFSHGLGTGPASPVLVAEAPTPVDDPASPPDPDELRAHLDATVEAILRGTVVDQGSPFANGFYLIYDAHTRSYRVPHWIWAWGPTMRLLLDARPYSSRSDELLGVAHGAAISSSRFLIDESGHPADGISTVRWYAALGTEGGSIRYASLADSLFLSGWGWIPVHAATHDPALLRAAGALVDRAATLLERYVVPPQDYVFECEYWTPHTLDESGFGMVGFEALHRATGDDRVLEIGTRYIEQHLETMMAEEPFWYRFYMRGERRAFGKPDVKGHAWIIDTYLSAYGLTGTKRYLDLAIELADRTVACQREDGAWTIQYRIPEEGDLIDDKGIAIWAYELYRLHAITGTSSHLEAARRSLGWCMRNRSGNPAVQGYGLMINEKPMAHVTKRPMSVLYSTTFLGLALIEELRLAGS